MFTGIIQAVGQVGNVAALPAGQRLTVGLGGLVRTGRAIALGDSIAVNGACLTVAALAPGEFVADLSLETLALTTLGGLTTGSPVNLELALTLQDPLGGHLVSGHVDGVGEIVGWEWQGGTVVARLRVPEALRRYLARKGSVAVDGISLTVNDVQAGDALLTLVPHTLAHTIMSSYGVGTRVNVEVDLLARYAERLLARE